jgi:multidrug resistance efflux pump
MIAFMTLCYVALLAALVYFKVIRLNLWWKLSPAVFCVICLALLIFPMQWGAPSGRVNVYRAVVEVIPNVPGEVLDVPARPLEPLQRGEVLFTVNPAPFQAEVDRLEAALREAEQAAQMLPADLEEAQAAVARCEAALVDAKQQAETLNLNLTAAEATVAKFQAQLDLAQAKLTRAQSLVKDNAVSVQEAETEQRNLEAAKASLQEAVAARDRAKLAVETRIGDVNTIVAEAEAALRSARAAEAKARLALQSTINGENTTVAQIRAQLASAKLDLGWTTVRAPSDGYAIGLSLRPGQRVAQFPVRGWITFVETDRTRLAVMVNQNAIRHVAPGQSAEVIFKLYPGRTFSATVEAIGYITAAGQLEPSGRVPTAPSAEHSRLPYGVILALDDERIDASTLPGGAGGTAAIYTDSSRITHIIRRVELRMKSWLNYIVP